MGLHYVNGNLVNGGVLDPTRPQIVIYEPMPDGTLKLIGADYLVIAEAWHKKHPETPEMMGQLFHLLRLRIVSDCRPSIRCTYGRGRTIRTGPL